MTSSESKTVRRALAVLKAFSDETPSWTLTGLASHLGLHKTTLHRLLATLKREGFLERQQESGGYRLGPELIVLGSVALRANDFREVARKEIEYLAQTTGADTSLECLVGMEVLILEEVSGGSLLRTPGTIGTRWPAHATATGKLLLAFADPAGDVNNGPLERLTDRTIDSWAKLYEALEEVRDNGFATNVGELERGYVAVAAPVRNRDGHAVAAISAGGSLHRVPESRIPEMATQVVRAADRISRRLGFRETR